MIDFESILKITATVVASVGGIGAFIGIIIHYCSDRIATYLEAIHRQRLDIEMETYKHELERDIETLKHELERRLDENRSELDKKLEVHKSLLDNKTHISKARFDAEFSAYQQLSRDFFKMVKDISRMIPPNGIELLPPDKVGREDREKEVYKNAEESLVQAQDTLYGNVVILQDSFFRAYDELRILGNEQLLVYNVRWDEGDTRSYREKRLFSSDDLKRTTDIKAKFETLNSEIREYLNGLQIID